MKLIVKISFFILCLCYGSTVQTQQKTKQDIEQDVWNTVKNINRHWAITENMDSLSLYIHSDMILISPDGTLQGKNNIIDAYRAYANYAKTVSFIEEKPFIRLYNDNKTAVVSYKNELKAKNPNGEVQIFQSKDMYTLVYENGRWYAVSQHYSFIKD